MPPGATEPEMSSLRRNEIAFLEIDLEGLLGNTNRVLGLGLSPLQINLQSDNRTKEELVLQVMGKVHQRPQDKSPGNGIRWRLCFGHKLW